MKTDKIILGIDPGTTIMGYGIIHIKGSDMHLIQMGVLHLSKLNSRIVSSILMTAQLKSGFIVCSVLIPEVFN